MEVKGRKRALNIFGDAMSTVVEIYILLILTVMPFYFTDGYGRIGTNKYQFFHGVTDAKKRFAGCSRYTFWIIFMRSRSY